jgi:hypothetical protein
MSCLDRWAMRLLMGLWILLLDVDSELLGWGDSCVRYIWCGFVLVVFCTNLILRLGKDGSQTLL